MLALKSRPSTAQTAANVQRERRAGASSAPTAPSPTSSAAAKIPAVTSSSLGTNTLPGLQRDDTVGDLPRPRKVVRDDERPPPRRLRAKQRGQLGLALGIDPAGRLVEHEQ